MAGNAQKTPWADTFGRAAAGAGLFLEGIQGQGCPATLISLDESGTIATVNLEISSDFTLPQVTCPVGFPEFIRWPLQPGCKGVILPAAYYMGGMSDLGGGTATLTRMANLATCIFWPVGNAGLVATPNPRAAVLYGPDGAILTNEKRDPLTVKIVVDENDNVLIYGARSVSTDCHGYGERITYQGGNSFLKETFHDGADVTETEMGYNPPEIPPP